MPDNIIKGLGGKAQLKVQIRSSPYPVMNEIERRLSKAYKGTLDGLMTDIEKVLDRARGTVVKGGLYVVEAPPGRDRGEYLAKALKAGGVKQAMAPGPKWTHAGDVSEGTAPHGAYMVAPKGNGFSVSYGAHGSNKSEEIAHAKSKSAGIIAAEKHHTTVGGGAPAAGDRKWRDIKDPGVRGGKYWRDDHGHIRYGTKPTARFHTEVGKDEAIDLSKHIWSVLHPDSQALINALIDHTALSNDDISAVRDLSSYIQANGGDIETAFRDAFDWGAVPEEKIADTWQSIQRELKAGMQNPDVMKAMEEEAQQQAEYSVMFEKRLAQSKELLKSTMSDILTGSADEGAVRLLAGALDINTIFSPKHSRDDVDIEDRDHRDRWFGKLYVRQSSLDILHENNDRLNSAQLLIASIADKFKSSKSFDEKQFETAEGKPDPKSLKYADEIAEKYAEETGEKMSGTARGKLLDKLADVATHVAGMIEDYHHDRGGEALSQMLQQRGLGKKALASPTGIKDLLKADADKKQLVKDALAAQDKRDLTGLKFTGKLSKDFKLFDHQKAYVQWMSKIKRGLNAADTGGGKTPISIAFIDHLIASVKEKRGIFVLPPAVMAQWPEQIEKFRPGSKVLLLQSSQEGMSVDDRMKLIEAVNRGEIDADFVLMSAGLLDTDTPFPNESDFTVTNADGEEEVDKEAHAQAIEDHLANDRLVQGLKNMSGAFMVDEAHSPAVGLKNPANKKHMITKEILKGREHAFGLTATPQANEPQDIYHLMELFHPGSAGDYNKFIGKIAVYEENPDTGKMDIMGWQDLDQLGRDIKPYVYAKSKFDKDVAYDAKENPNGVKLPAGENTPRYLSMAADQKAFYDKASEGIVKAKEEIDAAEGEEKAEAVFNALVKISQQRQAAIHPRLLDPEYKGRGVKIDWTVAQIRDHFSNPDNADKPVVIFSDFSSAFDILQDELAKSGVHPSLIGRIDQSESNPKNRAAMQNAINKSKMKVLMVGLKAGGAGLNLQGAANRMIFLDKPFAPSVAEQAYGRVFRTGNPHDKVFADHLYIAGTYDEALAEKLASKTAVAKGILNATKGEEVIKRITTRAIVDFIAEYAQTKTTLPAAMQAKVDAEMKKIGMPTDPKKIPQVLKEEYDLQPEIDKVKENAFLKLGQIQIQNQLKLNEIDYKNKHTSRDDYEQRKAKLEMKMKHWEESNKANLDIPMAEWRKDRGTIFQAKSPAPEYAFLTEDNPFPATSKEAKVFEAAKKKNLTTPKAYVEAMVKPKYGATWGTHEQDEMENARDIYRQFWKQGLIGTPKDDEEEAPKAKAGAKVAKKPAAKETKPKTKPGTKNPYAGKQKRAYDLYMQYKPKSVSEWAAKIKKEYDDAPKNLASILKEHWKTFEKDGNLI